MAIKQYYKKDVPTTSCLHLRRSQFAAKTLDSFLCHTITLSVELKHCNNDQHLQNMQPNFKHKSLYIDIPFT